MYYYYPYLEFLLKALASGAALLVLAGAVGYVLRPRAGRVE